MFSNRGGTDMGAERDKIEIIDATDVLKEHESGYTFIEVIACTTEDVCDFNGSLEEFLALAKKYNDSLIFRELQPVSPRYYAPIYQLDVLNRYIDLFPDDESESYTAGVQELMEVMDVHNDLMRQLDFEERTFYTATLLIMIKGFRLIYRISLVDGVEKEQIPSTEDILDFINDVYFDGDLYGTSEKRIPHDCPRPEDPFCGEQHKRKCNCGKYADQIPEDNTDDGDDDDDYQGGTEYCEDCDD